MFDTTNKKVRYFAITFATGDPSGEHENLPIDLLIFGFDKPTPEDVVEFCERFKDELHMEYFPDFDFVANIRELTPTEAHQQFLITEERFKPIFSKETTDFLCMYDLDLVPDYENWQAYDWPPIFKSSNPDE